MEIRLRDFATQEVTEGDMLRTTWNVNAPKALPPVTGSALE